MSVVMHLFRKKCETLRVRTPQVRSPQVRSQVKLVFALIWGLLRTPCGFSARQKKKRRHYVPPFSAHLFIHPFPMAPPPGGGVSPQYFTFLTLCLHGKNRLQTAFVPPPQPSGRDGALVLSAYVVKISDPGYSRSGHQVTLSDLTS